jgi:MarR family transcriptional regulator, organic hydroperoxide resistance regulator
MEQPSSALPELFRLSIAIQQLNKVFEAEYGATLLQWYVLRVLLDSPGVSAQRLAVLLGVHPSTLSQMLKRMTLKKLIVVLEDPLDSRKRLISLTRAGKLLHDSMEKKATGIFSTIQKISPELKNANKTITSVLVSRLGAPE